MTDYRKEVLSRLLDSYENQQVAKTMPETPYLDIDNCRDLFRTRGEERESFIRALEELEADSLVSVLWEKNSTRVPERISLFNMPENIRKAFESIGRIPRARKLAMMTELLEEAADHIDDRLLHNFTLDELNLMRLSGNPSRFFSDDIDLNRELVEVLVFLSGNEKPTYEDGMSERLFNDRKHFRSALKDMVLEILSVALRSENVDDRKDLLPYYQVYSMPDFVALSGSFRLHYKNGKEVQVGKDDGVWYIDVFNIARLDALEVLEPTVLFIEDRTSFHCFPESDSVAKIWASGLCGRAREAFLKLIGSAKAKFLYFGSIETESFRSFIHFRESIASLQPFLMDEKTFSDNISLARPLKNKSAEKRLSSLMGDDRFSVFHDVIEAMLESGMCLDQDALSLEALDG